MATLSGNSINTSYQSLLKTEPNTILSASEQIMTDGLGNQSTLSLGTTSASFTGDLDLSAATVTGLPGGAPGLVTGTETNSMKSAATLTTNPAVASTIGSIAIGENAIVEPFPTRLTWTALGHIAIGKNAFVDENSFGDFYSQSCIAIGHGATANAYYDGGSIAIGHNAQSTKMHGVAIGAGTNSNQFGISMGQNAAATGSTAPIAIGRNSAATGGTGSIALGEDAKSRANFAVTLGYRATVDDSARVDTVVVGYNAKSAQYSTALGSGAQATGAETIAIGYLANVGNNGCIAIGKGAQSNLLNGVALGYQVSALWADGTTVNQFAIANYASLDFVDDAAAATAGVPVGGVYHTLGAMKIRIA